MNRSSFQLHYLAHKYVFWDNLTCTNTAKFSTGPSVNGGKYKCSYRISFENERKVAIHTDKTYSYPL